MPPPRSRSFPDFRVPSPSFQTFHALPGHKMPSFCSPAPKKTLPGHKMPLICAQAPQKTLHGHIPHTKRAHSLPDGHKSSTKCAKTAPAVPLLKQHYLAHYFFDLRAFFIERFKSRSSNIMTALSCTSILDLPLTFSLIISPPTNE